ncbi:hypothetical protein [Desertibacillus haloalkaliphilus]|uniref:hypothetical protein n=1 Tax=Desertibacillus haloalkaliphilus TaxID=1328930 RepID=UPI001C275294|nr:hypothetical protein [Desertibacillus haloalkaliphilus]MBU8906886.1 hypothetical protein [Desertibacillus haloalkaliphilus]
MNLKGAIKMGYVPPHHNITAVNYGSRIVKRKSGIKPAPAPQKVAFNDVLRKYQGDPDSSRQQAKWVEKRKEIEAQLTNKGTMFDETG